MKKQRIILSAVLIALCSLLVFAFTACSGSDAPKEEYSVTVLSPEGQPLSGITVTWKSGGVSDSAVTGEDGVAKASLPLGTYAVTLSGQAQGLEYTPVSVTATMRSLTLSFVASRVRYTVTVVDKDGAAAAGVVVNWTVGSVFAGSSKTDAAGKAECELDYGDYTVTLSNLPEGNLSGGAKQVTAASPDARFELTGGNTVKYTVTYKTEGGLAFKDTLMYVYNADDTLVTVGRTDAYGSFTFDEEPAEYTVQPDPTKPLPDGYTLTYATLSPSLVSGQVTARSEVIKTEPSKTVKYKIGDIIHDYSFTTPYTVDGQKLTYKISEILKDKDAILINNWGVNCSWCMQEMAPMHEAYVKYSDKIELLAVNNYQGGDTDATISSYYKTNGYTFPMMRDLNGLATKFSVNAWPCTIVIDRYGAVARIESGAILSFDLWDSLIQKYVADDYVQSFVMGATVSGSITEEVAKPDVTVPADHYDKIAAAINDTDGFPAGASITWYGETESEYIWPFLLDTDADVSPDSPVIYSSNTGKPNSMSAIYATVNVGAGKVLTFDYYSSTHTSDVLHIIWDGKIIKQISGNAGSWQVCNLYSEITSGKHSLAMAYQKDSSGNAGKDNVFLRNFRFTDVAAITEPTDMLRAAAYGVPEENATRFPYYADVAIASDGYYHVDLSKLQNSQYAGNDDSPMLFVNLDNVTNWVNDVSIADFVYATDETTGEYLVDCNFTINGVRRDYRNDLIFYLKIASASDIPGFVPVDKNLHDLLVPFMARISGNSAHDLEWLEACYFYSHYGSGEPVGNPVIGLSKNTALPATLGTNTADLTRLMSPFTTTIFAFTPEHDAVYKIESLIPQNSSLEAQAWLYDDGTDASDYIVHSNGSERLVRDGVNEHNFEIYRYLTAGHKYYIEVGYNALESADTLEFKISEVGQTASVMLPASDNTFSLKLGADGKYTDELELNGAIKYTKDDDGYYRQINPDGTVGDYIYFDVKYPTAVTRYSITQLVDQYLVVPVVADKCDYKVFDLRYTIFYYSDKDDEGNDITKYYKKYDLSADDTQARYIDYTEIMKTEYIDKAYKDGELEGLVKVDQRLVDIITLFIETRVNSLNDSVYEHALENEWLRFCWYIRTYDSKNI